MECVAIVYHSGVAEYDFGPGHPFRGDRFDRYMRLLGSEGLLSRPGVMLVEPEAATDADLSLAHSEEYIRDVVSLAKSRIPLSVDTPLTPAIVKAARLIVGSSLKAGELVAEDVVKIAQGVGGGLHHSGRDYGEGFCVFNDVAVCAGALLARHGLERVLVFDTDAHTGNGTMDIFYEDPRVLYISVHQDPRTIYPSTGFVDQIGRGAGEGYTVNVPLPPGADDACMGLVLNRVFKPLTMAFRPQVIIRNGGSDPLLGDGLTNLGLTFRGLWSMGKAVAEASSAAGCGLVDLCCSGYNPETVAEGWFSILSGELGLDLGRVEQHTRKQGSPGLLVATEKVVNDLAKELSGYWNLG